MKKNNFLSKFHWGYRIILILAVFFIVNGIFIYIAFFGAGKTVDLVTPNYYEKELKYQDEINKQNNSIDLQPTLKLKNRLLSVTLPEKLKNSKITGDMLFYKPDDSKKDFSINYLPDSLGFQSVDLSVHSSGVWVVKMNFSDGSKKYYSEQKIMVQ